MGGIVNGLALSRLRPTAAPSSTSWTTCKPAVRLSALMNIPAIWVYTHDSIGLGEDGPTHQPVEQLATLRATPNVTVFRPADANETADRLAGGDGAPLPTALVPDPAGAARSSTPRRCRSSEAARGGYVLEGDDDPERDPDRDRLRGARWRWRRAALLSERGIRSRVVSLPSLGAVRRAAAGLPRRGAAAGRRGPRDASRPARHRGLGALRRPARGAIVGLDRFGASAPGRDGARPTSASPPSGSPTRPSAC